MRSISYGADREALSVREVAARLGVTPATLYRWAADGQIPSVRIGGRLLVPRHRLDRLLDGEPAAERSPLEEALVP